MSKAQKQTNNFQSQPKSEIDDSALHSAEQKNSLMDYARNDSTAIPSEVLDIARLLARIAVENYFLEASSKSQIKKSSSK